MNQARAAIALCLVGLSSLAYAHESRPLYIDIEQIAQSTYTLRWQAPPSVDAANAPAVRLPGGCAAASGATLGHALQGFAVYRCEAEITGTVSIEYRYYNPSIATLIRFSRRNGETHTATLGADQTRWAVPAAETASGVAGSYFALGVEHILAGLDHLLFLVALLFIAGTWRRMLVTVTGFTVAHSVTLCLAALGIVQVPVAATEAAIALSIVFLAAEIARSRRDTLTWRYPIAVSSSFGLLHGLGFAAVLGEIGLPQTERLVALLCFNLGVEAGQVLFVAGLAAVWIAGRAIVKPFAGGRPDVAIAAPRLAAYGVGIVASYWLLERLLLTL